MPRNHTGHGCLTQDAGLRAPRPPLRSHPRQEAAGVTLTPPGEAWTEKLADTLAQLPLLPTNQITADTERLDGFLAQPSERTHGVPGWRIH